MVTVAEKSVLPCRLAEMGQHVGSHLLDVLFVREKGFKREIKLLSMLIFVKSNFWKVRHDSLHTVFTGTIQLIFVKSNFWKVRHDSLQTVYRYNTADLCQIQLLEGEA